RGWLCAALGAASIEPLPPTALGGIVERLRDGATILALVPTLARLLVARAGDRREAFPALRVAMIGAGPVDASLDEAFHTAFGIRLARNYGSTETGAVIAGLPPLPPHGVGRPLDGVEARVLDTGGEEVAADGIGELHLVVDGERYATHDLARRHDDLIEIVGRRS